jgi:UDP-glucose 4-epimerase
VRSIVEAESAVQEFAEKNPDVTVTKLRFCNVLAPDLKTSHARLLSLPVVPMILGFDPRYQFIHADDVVAALEFAVHNDLPDTYNAAADGVLVLSEVIDLLGKRAAPILPPFGTSIATSAARPFGVRVPPEVLQQLRYGRAIDNRKLKATGFKCRYTTRETVVKFAEYLRLRGVMSHDGSAYRYEKEVEDFLHWSPSVRVRSDTSRPPRYFPPAPEREPSNSPGS